MWIDRRGVEQQRSHFVLNVVDALVRLSYVGPSTTTQCDDDIDDDDDDDDDGDADDDACEGCGGRWSSSSRWLRARGAIEDDDDDDDDGDDADGAAPRSRDDDDDDDDGDAGVVVR